VASICECGNEPLGSINVGKIVTSRKPVGFSRRTLLCGMSKEVHTVLFLFMCFSAHVKIALNFCFFFNR